MAVANYTEANGRLPPAYVLGPDGKPWHSWRVLILPYIEHDQVFKAYRFNEPWNGPNNSQLAAEMPKVYAFHNTKTLGTTSNYLAVVGKETMWPGATGRKRDELKDAAGDTILIVENNGLGVHWMEPRDLAFATMDFRLDSPNGVSSWYRSPAIVTAEGGVRMLSPDMPPETLRAALTVAGGETFGDMPGAWQSLTDGRDRERKEP